VLSRFDENCKPGDKDNKKEFTDAQDFLPGI
jgi:hypothetical protein